MTRGGGIGVMCRCKRELGKVREREREVIERR